MRPGTSERYDRHFWLCPVCEDVIASESTRDEPVLHGENGRDLGWRRTIRTIKHRDGREHRVPIGCVFRRL